MTDLCSLAKGQDCEIRLVGICNRNNETTVPAHFRIIDVSGIGLKSPDIFIAFACSACHDYVDTHEDDATQCAHLRGVIRTQAKLLNMGVLLVKGERDVIYKPPSKILPRRSVC